MAFLNSLLEKRHFSPSTNKVDSATQTGHFQHFGQVCASSSSSEVAIEMTYCVTVQKESDRKLVAECLAALCKCA